VISGGGAATGDGRHNIFLSYAPADVRWAEWAAWALENAGYSVLLREWNVVAGTNWVAHVDNGLARSRRTVLLLSRHYLAETRAMAEWRAVWAADPSDAGRKLLVARLANVEPPGLLASARSVDLFDLDERQTREALLTAVSHALSERPEPAAGSPPIVRTIPGRVAFPGTWPEVWNIPPRVVDFIGRDDLLNDLHEQLTITGTAAVCSLHGLGGVGKTALAIEYAYRHAADYDIVWWLLAEDPALLDAQLATLAARLGLADDTEPAAVLSALRQSGRRWLLILDNLDDVDFAAPFRPITPTGRLLITSRRTSLDNYGPALAVAVFTRTEAVKLLARRVHGIDAAAADRIAALLGDLPLALQQAAGYLRHNPTTRPSDYAHWLQDRIGDMVGRGRVADRPGVTIANLWELSLTQLRAVSPAAVELLDLLAQCAPAPVPLDLFAAHPDQLPYSALRAATRDPLAWTETIGWITAYSLGHADRNAQTLTVHRLTAAAIRASHITTVPTPEDSGRTGTAPTLLRLLRHTLPPNSEDPAQWPRWAELLPHLRALLDNHDDETWDDDTAHTVYQLHDDLGVYLQVHGRSDTAVTYLTRALALSETRLGHPRAILHAQNNLAVAYAAAGRVDQAIRLHEQQLAGHEQILGPDHPETLTSRNNLGNAYHAAGQVGKAVRLLEQTRRDRLRILGPEHPDTMGTANNLAYAYLSADRVQEAIELYEQTLPDLARLLGHDHPHTLIAQNNLGLAYTSAGRTHQAIQLYDQTLVDGRRFFGQDHPHTLGVLGNLAGAYEAAGRIDAAIELYQQTTASRLRILGPDHPDTLTLQNNLANAYESAGQVEDAIDLYERTLAGMARVFGPDHPETLTLCNNLAYAFQTVGRQDDAIRLFETTLADRLRVLDPEHPDIQQSRNNLASVYTSAGRFDEAIHQLEAILTGVTRRLGPDHPQALASRNILTIAYWVAGRAEAAARWHR
jgi:tetratricopeptide (TPR) repeat protein